VGAFDPRRLAGAVLGPSKADLKAQLLQAIEGTNTGADATVEQAMAVDAAAAALESKGSTGRPTAGPLSGEWELVYTTESDVHAFLQRKVLVREQARPPTHPPWRGISRTGERALLRLEGGKPRSGMSCIICRTAGSTRAFTHGRAARRCRASR